MADKNYPIIIQTWISGKGSRILTGPWHDKDGLKWAREEVLQWNELPTPQPGQSLAQQRHFHGYRLCGIISYGGVEDFGRPFTEIRAILLDSAAIVPPEAELEQCLLAIPLDTDPSAWTLRLAVAEERPAPTLPSPVPRPAPIRSRSKVVCLLLSLILISLAVIGMWYSISQLKSRSNEAGQPQPISLSKGDSGNQTITSFNGSQTSQPPEEVTEQPTSQKPPTKYQITFRVEPSGAGTIKVNGKDVAVGKLQEYGENATLEIDAATSKPLMFFSSWASAGLTVARIGLAKTSCTIDSIVSEKKLVLTAIFREADDLKIWRADADTDYRKKDWGDAKNLESRGQKLKTNYESLWDDEDKKRISRLETLSQFQKDVTKKQSFSSKEFQAKRTSWTQYASASEGVTVTCTLTVELLSHTTNFNKDIKQILSKAPVELTDKNSTGNNSRTGAISKLNDKSPQTFDITLEKLLFSELFKSLPFQTKYDGAAVENTADWEIDVEQDIEKIKIENIKIKIKNISGFAKVKKMEVQFLGDNYQKFQDQVLRLKGNQNGQ